MPVMDTSPPPPLHQRHWPLDLPSGLPFERYEHRRLTARDILVHRIMTAIFALEHPSLDTQRSTLLSQALAAPRQPYTRIEVAHAYDPGLQTHSSKTRTSIAYHNFASLKGVDRTLARDVEVLRKMLITRSPSEWVQERLVKPAKPVAAYPGIRPPITNCLELDQGPPPLDQRPSVEDEILELVRLHYLEKDDPVTRTWLGTIGSSRRTAFTTLQKLTAKRHSHKELAQNRVAWQERNEAEDHKRWYPEDTAHLKALQTQTHVTSERALYDGGAFLPRFQRNIMQSKANRANYLNMMDGRIQSYFTYHHSGSQIQEEVYPWPEGDAPRRVLHVPSVNSWRQKQHYFRSDLPPVDFASGRTGRGLDRDGIWSTGRWYGDSVPRGRTTRRARRRAASEPPPELFTTARLPVSFNTTRELLIFPKMSLSVMERRTRRRSLSRTRIAEMFNWDITIEDPPPEPPAATYAPKPPPYPWPKWLPHDDDERVEWRKDRGQRGGEKFNLFSGNPHPASPSAPCKNCASTDHATQQCRLPCGHCGAPNPNVRFTHSGFQFLPDDEGDNDHASKAGMHDKPHLAPGCPVAHHNRCKCAPFPQFHTAAKCLVLCSRPCGNTTHPPGHFRHRNAMECKSRCCICGLPGHSGIQCTFKTCRCGGKHLGQDCTWQPTCRVVGCSRFHCGVHCSACGVDPQTIGGDESVLIGGLCPTCMLERGILVAGHRADEKSKSKFRRRRKRPSNDGVGTKKADKAKMTWYAPLAPRTRPLVGNKSGKSAARWMKVDGEAQVKIGGCR
ncbi:hypothetical protein N0V82_010850 [Gnomoniopsis sp. IMI 355080]|nr:hypothetical protein N0V82_010850 [Gnomoniopsis sp. IMI 355080]